MKEILAERLRKCRKEAGLTQIKAATYCDMTENGYQNYENAIREPRVINLVRIAEFYEVPVDYLVGMTDEARPRADRVKGARGKDILAKRLRTCREKAGLSQFKAAVHCDTTLTSYVNYELANQNPRTRVLMRIAEFYNVSVDYLVGLTDDPEPYPKRPQ